ncbi:MAG: hypothetical protein VXW32_13315 [Myxococcota bacterium]|nr:hypothetical protein [Myxococcota bacterium]
MRPSAGLLNALQGIVYSVLAGYFSQRWTPGAVLLGIAAFLQFGSAGMVLMKHPAARGVTRWTALISLGVVALLIGLHLQVAVHIIQTFTPIGAKTGWGLFASLAAALPWVLFFPLWQWRRLREPNDGADPNAITLTLLLLAPPTWTALQGQADVHYAKVDGATASAWLWATWHGDDSPPPKHDKPVSLLLTHLRDGKTHWRKSIEASDLLSALPALVPKAPPEQGDVLLLEAVSSEGSLHQPILSPNALAIAPGVQSFRTANGPLSLRHWLGSNRIQRALFAFEIWLPTVQTREPLTGWTRQDAWMVDAMGPKKLARGWTQPERIHIMGLDQAAEEAARHLRYHMQAEGKFAYVVYGPSGQPGGGYNFPRHAGGAWFMARMGSLTRDPNLIQAAGSAINFLVNHTTFLNDGRAYVLDPSRRDGLAWVGTTALALLALLDGDAHPELQRAYTLQLAESVDSSGKVRGNMTISNEQFSPQPAITYAQGQVLLALARAQERGIPGAEDALNRAAAYVESDYWPLPAARFGILDEHWMCLASNQLDRMGHSESGRSICEAYLAQQEDLNPESPLTLSAGPAGGIAEAWMAAALMDARDGIFGRHYQEAIAYGKLLIAQRYRASDAALLPKAEALIGGFRDSPWELDVRVDAVQHIGFALLDLADVLRMLPAKASHEI